MNIQCDKTVKSALIPIVLIFGLSNPFMYDHVTGNLVKKWPI